MRNFYNQRIASVAFSIILFLLGVVGPIATSATHAGAETISYSGILDSTYIHYWGGSFTPDGHYLYLVANGNGLLKVDVSNPASPTATRLPWPTPPVGSYFQGNISSISPDGTTLLVAGGNDPANTALLKVNLANDSMSYLTAPTEGGFYSTAFSGDSRYGFLTSYIDHCIYKITVSTGIFSSDKYCPAGTYYWGAMVATSTDLYVVTPGTGANGFDQIVDLNISDMTKKTSWTLPTQGGGDPNLVLVNNVIYLSGGYSANIAQVNVVTGATSQFAIPGSQTFGIAVSSDGGFALTNDQYNNVIDKVNLSNGAVTVVGPTSCRDQSAWQMNLSSRGVLLSACDGSFALITTNSTSSTTTSTTTTTSTPPIIYSKPSAPSNVTASLSNGTATVSFTPGTSGNLATYNQIDMFINGQAFGNICNVTGATSCPIANLGPDATFTFTVTAVNSKGSATSAVSNAVSYASPTTVPPTTTTTTTTVPLIKLTITCVKGKMTKKVTAVSPVCPAGYKKK
jgi:hypothetical protein